MIVTTTCDDTPPKFNCKVHKVDLSPYHKFGFQTDSWYKLREEKMTFLLANMTTENDYIISCDPDIVPMNVETLVEEARALDLDYYGAHESGQYRSCFFIVKCNETMRLFVQNVLNIMKVRRDFYAEQSVINQTIHNVKHAPITSAYSTSSQRQNI